MCELYHGEDPRTDAQRERDRVLYLAQFGAVGLLRAFDAEAAHLQHTCPACGDPTDQTGYCRACQELAEDQFIKVLRARGLAPLYDAKELANLRWRDYRSFVQRLAAMSDAQLRCQADAYVAYLHSHSATDLDVEHVVRTWRIQIATAAESGLLEVA